jgi:DNA-binding transcriptional LysR family regulator
VDLDAVRTFVAAVDGGRLLDAADELGVTQQAVSKRVAALEKDLGVRLLTRTPRGVQPTAQGRAFLPHARELLAAEERAAASVRPDRRPLRVDVINPRIAPARLLQGFHRAHPDTALEVVTLFDAAQAVAAVRSGAVDATFRAVTAGADRLPGGISAARVLDEPIDLLTGHAHPYADAASIAPADLAGRRVWMPAIVAGTEWAAFYEEFARDFGIVLDAGGPNFGTDALLDAIAESPSLATFAGAGTHLVWPAGHDLRRVPMRGPAPLYPHSLIWRTDNAHPALAALHAHLANAAPDPAYAVDGPVWTPRWARRPAEGR